MRHPREYISEAVTSCSSNTYSGADDAMFSVSFLKLE